ncbi:MAG: hypothetical protein ABJA74_07915 [Lapillicoccus sp.]
MPSTVRTFGIAALAAGVVATASVAVAAPAHAAGTKYGCPYGAVCIYPQNADFTAGPEAGGIYYSYGPHNLVNQFGLHHFYNNQYGGAGFKVCAGYNGVNCSGVARATGGYAFYDLTPINSIVLVP